MRDIATLIYSSKVIDSEGDEVSTDTEYEVYVNEKSITRTEFYQSLQAGTSPKITLELRIEDFEQTKHTVGGKPVYAEKVEYGDVIYDILRTYKRGLSMIELICG